MSCRVQNKARKSKLIIFTGIKMKITIASILLLFSVFSLSGQDAPNPDNEKIKAKGIAVNEQTIKLRWAPANTRAWVDGKKYGYVLERYALIVDSVYQKNPVKGISGLEVKAAPLTNWEKRALESDYAAVVAQAFYGDNFELTSTSSNIGDIMNQANELEQRFATSVFMAEYDYEAAELAGWAYTDYNTRKNELYLYRIILNRPRKQAGDTATVFIGYADKRELPQPLNPDAVWGDKSVMLMWNYELLSDVYHSYHIEKKSSEENGFTQITKLPVTALDANMKSIFYTDSLADNETQYSYRIWGVTTFNEEGPVSGIISGQGKNSSSCIPNILNGYFTGPDKAHISLSFNCESIEQISQLGVKRASAPDGGYQTVVDKLSPQTRDVSFNLHENISYVKVFALTKDSMEMSSLPFLLSREDTVPPAIPTGLTVEIDSSAVAHLSWNPNTEPDLRGYRILRSFNSDEEKSSIVSKPVLHSNYIDTLSLSLGNEKVYYSITAMDTHYNESAPGEHVAAEKPSLKTPALPAITGYEISGDGNVSLSWITDKSRIDTRYRLNRIQSGKQDSLSVILETDEKTNTYTDEVEESGDYTYWLVATDTRGKSSESPQRLSISTSVSKSMNGISGFNFYVNREDKYIELSWRKHPQAALYRIYKQAGDKPAFLWKELDVNENKVVDERLSSNTVYRYTILFISSEGRMSPAKTIKVDY
jgi:fibronectin type 3 domain-containing protein